MLKKVLGRAVAGTAVAGTVIALAPLGVASPQIANMACDYPDTIATTTTLTLTHTIGQYGQKNKASVTVTSGSGTPSGTVVLKVGNASYSTLTLNGSGSASRSLPRLLSAQHTYKVSASYQATCDFMASSDTAYYTVMKAHTHTSVYPHRARAHHRIKVGVSVHGTTGINPQGGAVRVKIYKHGHLVDYKFGLVRSGRVTVHLHGLRHGRYLVRATYLGTHNFKRSSDTSTIKIH